MGEARSEREREAREEVVGVVRVEGGAGRGEVMVDMVGRFGRQVLVRVEVEGWKGGKWNGCGGNDERKCQ